ncbi:hypothetical protein FG386_000026 [Cryptosporidium ryanae]|uniref:uncharacterized protein n=1 Tax=Cryptosporidium ryanae TaxID=515981 RepID=UPI00351A97D9|nr:hypothetical protein FG386_000026 [Cryptosporidium ryanae]
MHKYHIICCGFEFIVIFVCFFISSHTNGSKINEGPVASGLPPLLPEETYNWSTLRDYVEQYDQKIEKINKAYPALADHLSKSQWYSIVEVLKCEFEIDEEKEDVFPPRIKVRGLPEIIDEVNSLWKEINFIYPTVSQEEFIQKCPHTIRRLIHHKSITIQTYDPGSIRSICHDAATMFFNPAMLFEEMKVKTDYERQRFPISSLTCIDQQRVRIGQWSAIVHLHSLDLEDGRDRIFGKEEQEKGRYLPYFPPDSFVKGIEEENFDDACKETLNSFYSRLEEKNVVLNIFCTDAKIIYYSNPLEISEKYNIYGSEIEKLNISEINKKASRTIPPSLTALNLMEYRILRISQWSRIVEQHKIDQESNPRYDRIYGKLSIDPRPYGFVSSLNYNEFEINCLNALKHKVEEQERKGISFGGKFNTRNSRFDQPEDQEEWEYYYTIELSEPDSFCRDAAGLYFGMTRDSFAVPRNIPLIGPLQLLDPGMSVGKSDSIPDTFNLNKQRSLHGSKQINNISWRIQASIILWEKLTNYRVYPRIEEALTNIQWQKIKQQADGFLFFNIGINSFLDGVVNPPKSMFLFSDDPFGMYNQCIHIFSESRRRQIFNKIDIFDERGTNYYSSDNRSSGKQNKYIYRWSISKLISKKLLEKGITPENIDEFPELADPIKQSLCMEAVKEYFEDAIQCPFILDEVDLIKYRVKTVFPDNPFPEAEDPKLPDLEGDLEAQEQWKFIYQSSINSRELAKKDDSGTVNAIFLSQKMPTDYLKYRHSTWRPRHECYQDMAINCIQSSWKIVESNPELQQIHTDLASALAIFCDTTAIMYFERKKQWRQLIKLIKSSQKYSSLFDWLRRGYYLPDSYNKLNIDIVNGRELEVPQESLEKYSNILFFCLNDLVKYRYLAPFTFDLKKICDSIAFDMSVSATRGIWVGLVPVDSEVLIEIERFSSDTDMHREINSAVGYHPVRNQFDPKGRTIKKSDSLSNFKFKREKDTQNIVKMIQLKQPIKTTVIPKIRLMQYKEIVEKDEDDIPLEYPQINEKKGDWKKYINKEIEIPTSNNEYSRDINEFINSKLKPPFYSRKIFDANAKRFSYKLNPTTKYKIPHREDYKKGIFFDLGDTNLSGKGNIVGMDTFMKIPVTRYNALGANYRVANIYSDKSPVYKEQENVVRLVKIPDIPRSKPLSKEELLERIRHIHIDDDEDEFDASQNLNMINDYINGANRVENIFETYHNKEKPIDLETKVETKNQRKKLVPSIEVIHNVIKSAEFYKIKANCLPSDGYNVGLSVSEKDLMRGARFVYRCLRMDGHFVPPEAAYRIWLRSVYLRRNTPKTPLSGYKKYMKQYIKKRSSTDDQIYCAGSRQDELDLIADSIATAAYINGIFVADFMNQICEISKDFLNGNINSESQCVNSFKRHIIKKNKEFVISKTFFPLICMQFEKELGKNIFSGS